MQIAGEVICEIFLQFPAARWKIGEPLIRKRMKRWTHYQRGKGWAAPIAEEETTKEELWFRRSQSMDCVQD